MFNNKNQCIMKPLYQFSSNVGYKKTIIALYKNGEYDYSIVIETEDTRDINTYHRSSEEYSVYEYAVECYLDMIKSIVE